MLTNNYRTVLDDGIGKVTLLEHMGDDLSVVEAARVSYDANRKTGTDLEADHKLIRYLADHDHGTPFEHTALKFLIRCPIFVRAQWHRHRIGWSYNEISRRYTNENIQFHLPSDWRIQNKSGNKQGSDEAFSDEQKREFSEKYVNAVMQANYTYEDFIALGVSNEQARLLLPQSMYTEFYATCNLRSLAHFLNLRDDEHAQPEIREYAVAMKSLAMDIFPVSISALTGSEYEPVVYDHYEVVSRSTILNTEYGEGREEVQAEFIIEEEADSFIKELREDFTELYGAGYEQWMVYKRTVNG